jgi:hypothetical protein
MRSHGTARAAIAAASKLDAHGNEGDRDTHGDKDGR